MSSSRLGRIAKEALLLIRKFMSQGDFQKASNAALKAAEAFNEMAKHSSGSSSKLAYQRARSLVEITKALRKEEPLPIRLVDALDSFFPEDKEASLPTIEDEETESLSDDKIPEEVESTKEKESVSQDKDLVGLTRHQELSGIAIACTLVEMLDRAKQSIRIMLQNFADVKSITVGKESCEVNFLDRLIAKSKDGVKVRIIIREPEAFDTASKQFQEAVESLLQGAPTIEIVVCSQMHIKSLIIDDAEVLESSANFTPQGLSGIEEQATWTNNSDILTHFTTRFEKYWIQQSAECEPCEKRTCETHSLTRQIQS